MGKQGHGIGKGKPKKEDRGFGRALIRQQQEGAQGLNGTRTREKKDMRTQLEASDLADYVDYLELQGKNVDVRRVRSDADAAFVFEGTLKAVEAVQEMAYEAFDYTHLPVPRKPAWSKSMSAEEVDKNERRAFVEWRRTIAMMEEMNNREKRATPFEKNIEVWRQLWRVLEKSDIAIQVVDARNPLLYYTADLVKYAQELEPKVPMMILLNKSDYLTEHQRSAWAEFLDSLDIKYVFYSAFKEQKKVDVYSSLTAVNAVPDKAAIAQAYEEMTVCDEEFVKDLVQDLCGRWSKGEVGEDGGQQKQLEAASTAVERLEKLERTLLRQQVLTREELISLLSQLPAHLNILAQDRHQGRVCVGMVGFPNVGKSSCINSILAVSKSSHGKTRVAVSSTPGKTKHFQTLIINEQMMLCDCPGLVFPSFMRSQGEMLCAGILPINQMRTYIEPAQVIASRVPRHLIEAAYGVTINRKLDVKDRKNRPPTATEMLSAYCAVKGYITGSTGRWDEFRACKELLKDFCDGLLLYVCPPGDGSYSSKSAQQKWLLETEKTMLLQEKIAERVAGMKLLQGITTEVGKRVGHLPTSNARNKDVVMGNNMVFGGGKYEMRPQEMQGLMDEEEGVEGGNPPDISLQELTESGEIAYDDSSDEEDDEGAMGMEGEPVYDDSTDDESGAAKSAKSAKSAKRIDRVQDEEVLTVHGKVKREHKRGKRWGKKGKKLRDRNPYGQGDETDEYTVFQVGATDNKAYSIKSTNRKEMNALHQK